MPSPYGVGAYGARSGRAASYGGVAAATALPATCVARAAAVPSSSAAPLSPVAATLARAAPAAPAVPVMATALSGARPRSWTEGSRAVRLSGASVSPTSGAASALSPANSGGSAMSPVRVLSPSQTHAAIAPASSPALTVPGVAAAVAAVVQGSPVHRPHIPPSAPAAAQAPAVSLGAAGRPAADGTSSAAACDLPLRRQLRPLPALRPVDGSRSLRVESWASDESMSPSAVSGRKVFVYRTRKDSDERLAKVQTLVLDADRSEGAQAASIFVCPGVTPEPHRPFLGVGGSFTEAAAVTLQRMSRERREQILEAYFSRERGLGYTLGRLHIGSCDFCVGSWTCGDLREGDESLAGFDIDRYHEAILPVLRRATAHAGEPLTLLASPWSPPAWMKTTGELSGDGRLRPECRGVWARHYVRFLEEMERAGVNIWAVSVQNEPEAAQIWESCIYSATEERDFVRDFLGPALHDAGRKDTRIVIWDHNRDGMLERAAVAYSDPVASRYIWGMGYHWYGDARFETWPSRMEVPYEDRQRSGEKIFELRANSGFDNVRRVAELRPDKHILFTEGCQELDERPLEEVLGDWKLGERYGMNMIADLNAGCEGWIDWNLVLDETGGPNHVENFCVAPVICDTRTDTVLYQSSFWYIGHIARFVRPGALRIVSAASRDALEVTAWRNVDNSVAVVVMNQSDEGMDVWLKVQGVGAAEAEVPPRSITTYVFRPDAVDEPTSLDDGRGAPEVAGGTGLDSERPLLGGLASSGGRASRAASL